MYSLLLTLVLMRRFNAILPLLLPLPLPLLSLTLTLLLLLSLLLVLSQRSSLQLNVPFGLMRNARIAAWRSCVFRATEQHLIYAGC